LGPGVPQGRPGNLVRTHTGECAWWWCPTSWCPSPPPLPSLSLHPSLPSHLSNYLISLITVAYSWLCSFMHCTSIYRRQTTWT
jgi:hypothetical protein